MFLATPKTFSISFKPTAIEIQARHRPLAVHAPPRLPRRTLTHCPDAWRSFFASSRPTLPFTSTLVLRMRRSRVRRFLSEYPAFDFQLSTFNLSPRVFLRFLTPYLAVHEHLSSPHPVQPSAEIPLRISCLLSTFNCRLLTSPRRAFFASSRPTLPFTGTLVLRIRCSRVRRFLSEYPAFDFQLSTFKPPRAGLSSLPHALPCRSRVP